MVLDQRLLSANLQDFIIEKSNSNCTISTFVLSKNPFPEIPIQKIAIQINGRQKALKKFPLWSTTPQCYFPPNLNLEQTSSETTARYKSSLVSGSTLLDVTGGFGIDDYYFSEKIDKIIHCELNAALSAIASHNFVQLKAHNIQCTIGDGLEILKTYKEKLDWIYIDPSRRSDDKRKVFFLEDCLPNIPKHLDDLFERSNNLLIKTAPLLDIKAGLKVLKYVKEIHIVAVRNDVKEMLWILEKNYSNEPLIKTINFGTQKEEHFEFTRSEESKNTAKLSTPLTYLYEPNAAILKSGAFSSIANQLAIDKLHINTHLYTSSKLQTNFPGRTFRILEVITYNKKAIKNLDLTKANITTRNFSESVATLRKKFGIKDGGDTYLFFTTTMAQQKVVILCKKAL